MVGAGIFSLLGAAGEVAGAAVWLSFLIAGGIALLQGYPFAKFGARYPSAAGLLEYVVRGLGNGHLTGIIAWLILAANAIVTGMVAVSFGSYASAAFTDSSTAWIKAFAVLLVLAMTLLNIVGSQAVARTQTVIVYVVLTILTLFAVATLANLNLDLLAFSGYPQFRDIVSSVALAFFAFLGFGVVTFTAKDLADASRQLPRAHLPGAGDRDHNLRRGGARGLRHAHGRQGDLLRRHRLGGCRGTDPRPGGLLAHERHGPVLDRRGDERGAVSGGGAVRADGGDRPVPAGARSPVGGRSTLVLSVAIASTVIVLLTFAFTTLVDEPATAVALVVILLLSVALDVGWKRTRDSRLPAR
jgi:hypothetical protein